jgi:hypothetical protein
LRERIRGGVMRESRGIIAEIVAVLAERVAQPDRVAQRQALRQQGLHAPAPLGIRGRQFPVRRHADQRTAGRGVGL